MRIQTKPHIALSGNQLKLLALVSMTCDHIGLQLFPQSDILRIIGRLAFPIFAYMIAEGCHYTRNRAKYLLTMAGMALLCQAVYFLAMGSLFQCVLVTFCLSISLIYLLDQAQTRPGILPRLAFVLAILAAVFLAAVLPGLLPRTDYGIDYGLMGIFLPLLAYLGKTKKEKCLLTAAGLVLLSFQQGGRQWYSLLVLPLLALYSGRRGKWKLKNLFYIYYPAHLAAIYLLSLVL